MNEPQGSCGRLDYLGKITLSYVLASVNLVRWLKQCPSDDMTPKFYANVPLFLFLVSVRQIFRQFVELTTVVGLDFGLASKNVLDLGHDALLKLQTTV